LKPPEATQGIKLDASAPPLAVSICVQNMKIRRQFLACNHGLRQGTKAFLLQARNRNDTDPAVNVGFTCSKKVGNAVARNRAKRRLREIARLTLPETARAGWDYVLIGRKDVTATLDFTQMQTDLRWALHKIHT
jgi:ribonuclease P protein component